MIFGGFRTQRIVCTLVLSLVAPSADDLAGLLGRARSAVASLSSASLSAIPFDHVHCLGILPLNPSNSSPTPEAAPAIVSCRIKPKSWGQPFLMQAKLEPNESSAGMRDLLFVTSISQPSPEQDGADFRIDTRQGGLVYGRRSADSPFEQLFPLAFSLEHDQALTRLIASNSKVSLNAAFLRTLLVVLEEKAVTPATGNSNPVPSSLKPGQPLPPFGGSPRPVSPGSPTRPAPTPPVSAAPPTQSAASPPPLPRVTGTDALLPGAKEPTGYGLYSYALITHIPSGDELIADRAFFSALFALPTAENLGESLPRSRINITEVPLSVPSSAWDYLTPEQRANYVIVHYDYGRAAAILAALPQRTGGGPVLVSVLTPIDVSLQPHPVLVEDLTRAQPTLMRASVDYFVAQTSKDQFWQESSLALLSLNLRNVLEVSAQGLGMSKEAVSGWVKVFQGK